MELALVNVCIKLDSKLGTSHNLKKWTHIWSRAGLGILMISCYTIFLKSIFDRRLIFISFVCYFHNCRGSSQGPPQEEGGCRRAEMTLTTYSKIRKNMSPERCFSISIVDCFACPTFKNSYYGEFLIFVNNFNVIQLLPNFIY